MDGDISSALHATNMKHAHIVLQPRRYNAWNLEYNATYITQLHTPLHESKEIEVFFIILISIVFMAKEYS